MMNQILNKRSAEELPTASLSTSNLNLFFRPKWQRSPMGIRTYRSAVYNQPHYLARYFEGREGRNYLAVDGRSKKVRISLPNEIDQFTTIVAVQLDTSDEFNEEINQMILQLEAFKLNLNDPEPQEDEVQMNGQEEADDDLSFHFQDEETNNQEEEEDLHFHFQEEETNNQEEEEEDLHFHFQDEETNNQEEEGEDVHFHFHDEEMNEQEEEEDLHYHFQDEEINEQEEEDEVHYHFQDEEINEQEEEEDLHYHFQDEEINEQEEEDEVHYHFQDEEINEQEEEDEVHYHFQDEEINEQEEEDEVHYHFQDEEINEQEEEDEVHYHFQDEEINEQEEEDEVHYHFQDEEINEQEEEDEVHYHFQDEEINEQEEEDEVHYHFQDDEPNGQDAQENLKMVQEDWQDYRFFPGVHDNLTAHTGDLDRSGNFILFNVFAVFIPFLILDLCLFLAFLPSALINLIALKKEETINNSRIAEDVNEDSFNNDVDELNKGNLQDIFFPCIAEDANEESFTTLTDGDDVKLNNCNLLVIPFTSLADMPDNFEEVENHPQEIPIFNYDLDHNMEAAEEEIRVPPVQDLATAFMGLKMGNVDHLTTLTEIFQLRVLKRLSKRKWIKPMNRVTKRRNDKLINKRK